jgi:hypothetical protein
MSALGLGRVKTAEDRRCRDNWRHVDGGYALIAALDAQPSRAVGASSPDVRRAGAAPLREHARTPIARSVVPCRWYSYA